MEQPDQERDTEEMKIATNHTIESSPGPITDAFACVIGQEMAKERLSYVLASAALGRAVRSTIVTGRTGLGKTNMTDAFLEGFAALGWKTYDFARPAQILGDDYIKLAEDIATDGLPVAVRIGEAHDLRVIKRVQLTRLHQFIMLFTDARNIGKTRTVNDGEIGGLIDWTRLIFILDTNFPLKLEEGKGSTSFLDRLMKIELEDYTYSHITQILAKMATEAGLRIHESTIDLIARCARGTARPLQNIISELSGMNLGSKQTINRQQVIRAIQLSRMYPLGLSVGEVKLLQYCMQQTKFASLCSLLPNMEISEVRTSIAFLQKCGRDKDGNPAPFLNHLSGGNYQTSPRGHAYLADLAKDGFKI